MRRDCIGCPESGFAPGKKSRKNQEDGIDLEWVAGFRWALLGNHLSDTAAPGPLFALSVIVSVVVLIGGLVFFRNTERSCADVIGLCQTLRFESKI